MESKELAREICKVLSAKKARDIVTIEVKDMTVITDYFVIASGNSTTQVRALCDYVDEEIEKLGINYKRCDGINGAKWIAMDYGDVIVHVFLDETRQFYHLDRLWEKDGNVTKYEE